MRTILSIYTADVRSMFKSRRLTMLVVALMLLPSAYAWINIKAVWDPYSNTTGIPVAIVNEDTGAQIEGKAINVGDETVNGLKSNPKLGWAFVDRAEAERGVHYGDYYAYLIIPSDFSAKLASILEAEPQQPTITYAINEKVNALAPKITSSGATGITDQISKSFTQTVSDAVLTAFHTAGIELQKELPTIQKVENGILELEKALPQIEALGQGAIALEAKLPSIKQKIDKVIALQQHIPDLNKAGDAIMKLETDLPKIKEALDSLTALRDKATSLQTIPTALTDMEDRLATIDANLRKAIEDANKTVAATNANGTDEGATIIAGELQKLTPLLDEVATLRTRLQETRTSLKAKVDEALRMMDTINSDWPAIEQRVQKAANFVRNDLPGVEADIKTATTLLQEKLPAMEEAIHKAADLARNDLPGFEQKVREAANKIRTLQSSADLNELISYLLHDPQKSSQFLADPVNLETVRLFPIDNYGTAMTPLYTMLALWVGGTILITALPVNVRNPEHKFRSYQVYFGRLVTFLSVGLGQALIATLGVLYLLHVHAANKLWFVLTGVFVGVVFVIITYTLRSIFGNVGSGLAMLFLVLQMSSSGVTFPISMTSRFFQVVSPFMPFTHAIIMFRETIGGMIVSTMWKEATVLLSFILLFFGLAVLLKQSFSKDIELNSDEEI
ncbi:putative membrane protein [Paenibacillus cellulosilyticus]|uniref:Putative membrane protein n=1 Tax=Paenibacillus cellulosilyticus TaxID=375489 RepID=A0A2V2Z0B9_9BACL|nr:YhgE/Pip domain-containing protein [Paenibacillus cellulosilyticus]PWW07487.1 putative membrane protein [Paenibacillus cellulosilyticus]QKS44359.1 YhgE/Pip domain-containing protein [Paenibacillus cellulosilyticus]